MRLSSLKIGAGDGVLDNSSVSVGVTVGVDVRMGVNVKVGLGVADRVGATVAFVSGSGLGSASSRSLFSI